MTTKTYQAQLPLRNHRIVTPVPMPRPVQPAHCPLCGGYKLEWNPPVTALQTEEA